MGSQALKQSSSSASKRSHSRGVARCDRPSRHRAAPAKRSHSRGVASCDTPGPLWAVTAKRTDAAPHHLDLGQDRLSVVLGFPSCLLSPVSCLLRVSPVSFSEEFKEPQGRAPIVSRGEVASMKVNSPPRGW